MTKILVIGETCKDVFVYGIADRIEPSAPALIFNEIYRVENEGMAGNVKENLIFLGGEGALHKKENWTHLKKNKKFLQKNY